ncbi:N-acetylmuramoyl-L-alanine amidase family protein [Candidatus Avelusimicrobium caledoniensis]|uniref:N-acetylmuramoyl-L-alanine amidase family protein n=1 Tax=Candidatus Avelusimicrobium caledoniensis TaxID=3416220 RepID=UPI003D12B448
MNKTLSLLLLLFFAWTVAQAQELPVAPYLPAQEKTAPKNAPITVQFPQENLTVARGAKAIFLFGQINLPSPVTLDINGTSVPVQDNGAFLTFLPVQSGNFTFELTAKTVSNTYRAVRHITVPGADIKDFSGKAEFDEEEIFPKTPVEMLPGDTLDLYARGTPGAEVTASLSGLKNGKSISLKEMASSPGVYRAQFVIDPEQKPKTVKAVYRLKDPTTHTNTKITAKEKIKILSEKESLRTAQITSDGVKLRKIPTARENLYPFYRAYGNVQINGRLNEQYRIRLNDSETAWLEMDKLHVTETTANTPNHLQEMNLTVQPDKTRLTFAGKHPVPISVHEFNNRFELTFYYTDGFDENFTADTTSPVVENVTWSEPEKNTILFKIYFRPDTLPWGHAYDFEDGNLVLDFIHNPTLTPTKNKPLAGARILLDAGHSPRRKAPYDGAVGPTGYLEYEGTLALAEDLKPLLEKQGATVILTRRGNNRKSLQERYEQALQENAHIFVSLHYNALPETINPLSRHRGYSVYYNYPHSFKLAQAVYQSFTKNVKLPDNGMIANDVLFIPRIPQIPSILVENAYMMIPEQEQMARTRQGRAPLVKALYEGILKFYGVKVPPQPQKKTAKKARRSSQKPAKKTYLRAGPKPVLKAGK